MDFIQIIEYHTSKADEIQKVAEEFQAMRAGSDAGPTPLQLSVCKDRDQENVYTTVVRFASYDDAMANSQRQDTSELAKKIASLCDGPPSFRNLDVVMEPDMGQG